MNQSRRLMLLPLGVSRFSPATNATHASSKRASRLVPPRKRWGWFLALAVVVQATHAADLVWQETEKKLLVQPGAHSVTTEFRFRNAGSREISVSVRPNCDCVGAKSDKSTYAPGEAGLVRVELDVVGREGRQDRTIAVGPADSREAPTMLKMIVEIPEPITIAPRFLFWRVGDSPIEKEISITLADPAKAGIRDVQCVQESFSARVEKGTGPGQHRLLIKPTTTEKLAQATIRLNATIEDQPRVVVLHAAVK